MLGATLQESGCHFRVWAPAAKAVAVTIEGPEPRQVPLHAEGEGYYVGEVDEIRAGTRYRYLVDGVEMPDPCSRFQPDGPHGPSQVVDPAAFRWTDHHWQGIELEGQVLYELHVGTFTAEGSFAAAATRLAHLRRLGVTAVEVMPLAACPGRFNWGYDGVAWFAPSHHYGPYEGFKAFVDAAHACGIGVILDVVYNHFGPDGNYARSFSSHYLSSKSTEWGEAINYDGEHSGPVREMVLANAREWIREFHLDGLRLDATQSIVDTGPSHIVAEIGAAARAAAGGRSVLLIAENEPQCATHMLPVADGGLGMDAMWNDDFHHTAQVAATGRREAYYLDYFGSPQEFVSASKRGFLFQGQYYRWQKQSRGAPLRSSVRRCIAFLQNHDQVANSVTGQRLHQYADAGTCRALTALLLLGPQTPMLFMGQEFHASSPFLFFADHQAPLRDQVLQGRREFLSQFPGAAADGGTAVSDPADEATFRRCALDWDECNESNPALHLHRDLLRLRRDDPVIRRQGDDGFDGAVLGERAFVLRWFGATDGDRLLIVNLGNDIAGQSLPEPLLAPPFRSMWQVLWSSDHVRYGGSGSVDAEAAKGWRIPGHSAMLFAAMEQTGEAA